MTKMKKKTLRKNDQLLENNLITRESLAEMSKLSERFSLAITPQMLELIQLEKAQHGDLSGPVVQQFLPNSEELNIQTSELNDPIGDLPHSPVKGIIHRYPDRCLLMPIMSCPVYCRFCFRRERVGNNDKALTVQELDNAYAYIKAHPEIWEVILTGGDPLLLKPKTLSKILLSLVDIPSVEVIRIHTKVPIVDSIRINADMLKALKVEKPVYIIVHANHASEFTEDSKIACAKIVDNGIPMLSHTVLLKGINNNTLALGTLMRTFVKNRIKPYYLHHLDLAKGTSHFRVSIQEGQALVKSLRGRYSGICQPTYILDIPGGHGKVPIAEPYITQNLSNDKKECYQIKDYQGNTHRYETE